MTDVRTTFFVRGRVQGVGFRWWTRARALELGLVGHARNMADGRVEVLAQGPADAVARLGDLLAPERAREQAHGQAPEQAPEQAPDVASDAAARRPGHVESCVAVPGRLRDAISGFEER